MYSTKPTSVNNKERISTKKKKDFNLKFIVIGDSRVGKTTLVEKYCGCHETGNNKNNNNHLYFHHTVTDKDWSCNLKIFDTAGQERYRSVTSSYYRGANGCIIAFDLSQETSFVNLENWYNDMLNYCNSSDVSVVLVGIQREGRERIVSTDRAQKFSDYLNLPYVEVNVDNQSEINDVFDNLAKNVVQRIQSREPVATMSTFTTTNLSKLVVKTESRFGCSCC